MEKYSGQQETVDKYLNAGITDISKIKTALQNNYSTDNNIAYMNMAKACPSKIFEDKDKFKTYLSSHGIPADKAEEIYNAVRTFR